MERFFYVLLLTAGILLVDHGVTERDKWSFATGMVLYILSGSMLM